MSLSTLYRPSLGLVADLYQVTMAYGYWKLARHDWESVFHWSLRRLPFEGGFAVACGQGQLVDLLEAYRFEPEDLAYLAGLAGDDGKPVYETQFLDYLARLEFDCDVDAIPEGTVCCAHEPLLRVRGPLLVCQLIETAVLNQLNFQTLVATKAARICHLAAPGQTVLEFGQRRAPGIDGAVSASRAAFIGGCAATSNLLAGRLHGIPVRGTQAHSWIMTSENEEQAFREFVELQPGNAVLLVDTYDTSRGVERAIEVGKEMRALGHSLTGIRLDSGDLIHLSREARRLLDAAGLQQTRIVASGDLDEHRIARLLEGGALIDAWGVGTRLVTGHPSASLSGVYKLGALRRHADEPWRPLLKLSAEIRKESLPGFLAGRRLLGQDGKWLGDVVYETGIGPPRLGSNGRIELVEPVSGQLLALSGCRQDHDLLQPLMRSGKRVEEQASLQELQTRVRTQVELVPEVSRRLADPVPVVVGLEPRLQELRQDLSRSLSPASALEPAEPA